MKYADE
jgi:acetylornithine deacetylase/succinyl-diaminopimelate desuccinylase-like protein